MKPTRQRDEGRKIHLCGEVHVHLHTDQCDLAPQKLDEIIKLLKALQAQGVSMSQEIDAMNAAVTKVSDASDSIITLVQNLAQILRDTVNSSKDFTELKSAVTAKAAELDAKATVISEAVLANTPAEPPVEPPVEPPA